MKKFRVFVVDETRGYFDIEAEDAFEATQYAEQRLQDGNTSWIRGEGSSCVVTSVTKL